MAALKLAFLVGVSDYGNKKTDLEFCSADVEAISQVLTRKGFECTKWVNKPLPEMFDPPNLPALLEKAKSPEDVVIFYFSGHGEDLGGEQILLGKGGKQHDMTIALHTANVMPLSNVLDSLAKIPGQKIVIVDCCRVESHDQKPGDNLRKLRAKTIQELQNCAIVFSAADGLKSFGNLDNSFSRFTQSFCEELKIYGRGFFAIAGSAISRVQNHGDEKIQTPWIYSSLQELVLDGYKVAIESLDCTHAPKRISNHPKGIVWAILSGSNALAKWDSKKFVEVARLSPTLAQEVIDLDGRAGHSEVSIVRQEGNAIERVRVTPATKWFESSVVVTRVSPKNLTRIYGAEWASDGKRLLGFGKPVRGKCAIKIWTVTKSDRLRGEPITGMPEDVECNSALWLDDNRILAAVCAGASDGTALYSLTPDTKGWRASLLVKLKVPTRVVALASAGAKATERVYLGCDDGAIGFVEINNPVEPELLKREHPPTGLTYLGAVPWEGASRGESIVQLGVISLLHDTKTGLIGLTYFDGSAAFWDPVLKTYVKAVALKGRPYRPHMAQLAASVFMVEGADRQILRVESC